MMYQLWDLQPNFRANQCESVIAFDLADVNDAFLEKLRNAPRVSQAME